MEYKLHRRPEIKLEVYEVKGFWEVFKRYHYLNHSCHKGSAQFVAFYNDRPVGFCSFISQPSPKGLIMRGHRLVVLPDYQGLGVAKKMLNLCGGYLSKKYKQLGFSTSQKGFAKSCLKDNNWKLIHTGRVSLNTYNKAASNHTSSNRNTYSFKWVGG